MEPLTIVKSRAVPLDRVNVDTDQIVPKQFLKLTSRTGYGKYLFYDWRFDSNGNPRQDFVLNDSRYAGRQILLARENFGSGSSREHAAWAIMDYGFRAVIAPSFADIFYNNCFKNGILPVRLPSNVVDDLFRDPDREITIDLPRQVISAGDIRLTFEVDEFRKKLLVEGLDSIGLTLQLESQIAEHEAKRHNLKIFS
jgi:3-isopropylmalate/(R)-2-methylmalate dehydratase small subunit